MSKPKQSTFTIRQSMKDLNWYWHEKINGRITCDSAEGDGYASKAGARRSLDRHIARVVGGHFRIVIEDGEK